MYNQELEQVNKSTPKQPPTQKGSRVVVPKEAAKPTNGIECLRNALINKPNLVALDLGQNKIKECQEISEILKNKHLTSLCILVSRLNWKPFWSGWCEIFIYAFPFFRKSCLFG